MAEGVDHAWLVDMVLQFMGSPNWSEPIDTFINEHCTQFDNFQEENKHEFFEVHTEYRNLIDTLLTAHLLEVDIDPAEFERKVVESGLQDDPRLQAVVSKLAAAEDFLVFKEMMVERHAGLQGLAEQGLVQEEEARQAAEAMAYAEAEAVAAAADQAERDAAMAAAYQAAEQRATAASAPPPPPAPAAKAAATPGMAPSAAEERAFGAGGGAYGRAQMAGGGAKKAGGNEKAAAIRSAILGAARK